MNMNIVFFVHRLKHWIERKIIKLISPVIPLPFISDPKLVMTLLVKNEADILEYNLLLHKKLGVDVFIVTDNDSTDNTPTILKKYKEKGWIGEIIIEKSNNHNQKEWVDRMIRLAKEKYKADWIINGDADEFWFTPSGNLKSEICNLRYNIISVPLVNVCPEENKNMIEWNMVVWHPLSPDELKKEGLSVYSIYNKQINKEMHRAIGYRKICDGNHRVEMFPEKRTYCSNITIYHYPIRGYVHFLLKVKKGGEAMLHNRNKHIATHWRALYEIYLQGGLEKEYEKIIANEDLNESLIERGIVVDGNPLVDIFRKL